MAELQGQSVGDLNLSIQALANDTLATLDAVIKRLDLIENRFNKISNVTAKNKKSSLNGDKSEKTYITNADGKRYLALEKNIKRAEKSLTSITTKFNQNGDVVKKTTLEVDKYGNKVTEVVDNSNKKTSLFDIGKFTAVMFAAKKLGSVVAKVAKSGADYVETLNLWSVSMGEFESRATVFVNKMNEAYGISAKTLMNAQATFNNMLKSLGNLSSEMAYSLSEAVTQMAVDYASLYNVEIEEAMTKFEAALAGQVRPIRSGSGYDITETTLYELYKSIGGEKTMRQLTQTEKRLLSIYAIFNQMNNSGAVGDMKDTIGTFANQSRIMKESWEDTVSYVGLILTKVAETSGIMVGINRVFAFTSEVFKAVAQGMGAMDKQGKGAFADATEGAEDLNKEVDEIQGKLLGFDKFRSLSGSDQEASSIDTTILNAVKSYDSVLAKAKNEGTELAKSWLEIVGLTYDAETSGYKVEERFKEIKDTVAILGSALVTIASFILGKLLLTGVSKLGNSFEGLGKLIGGLFKGKTLLIMGIAAALYYMYTTNEDFRDSVNELLKVLMEIVGQIAKPLAEILVAVMPVLAELLTWVAEILTPLLKFVSNVITLLDKMGLLKAAIIAITALIIILTLATKGLNVALLLNPWVWIVAGVIAVIAVIATLIKNFDEVSIAFKNIGRSIINFFANIFIGLVNFLISVVNLVVDILNTIASPIDTISQFLFNKGLKIPKIEYRMSYNPIELFASGGLPDKGSMFVAGEAGAEYVYNMPNGQSGVANIQQIAQATYSGTMRALNDWWGGSQARGDIPQLREANATGIYQAVTGVAKSYGERWSKY